MNRGVHGFPRHRPAAGLPAIRAMVKFDGTAPSGGAGAQLTAKALKLAYNIAKIVYNGSGDYTIHFSEPFETADFVTVGTAREGANDALLYIDTNDLQLASQKRIQIVNNAGTGQDKTEICVLFVA